MVLVCFVRPHNPGLLLRIDWALAFTVGATTDSYRVPNFVNSGHAVVYSPTDSYG